jgi:hypothetical protein
VGEFAYDFTENSHRTGGPGNAFQAIKRLQFSYKVVIKGSPKFVKKKTSAGSSGINSGHFRGPDQKSQTTTLPYQRQFRGPSIARIFLVNYWHARVKSGVYKKLVIRKKTRAVVLIPPRGFS